MTTDTYTNAPVNNDGQLYPEIMLIFCISSQCYYCQQYKNTIAMVSSLGIKHQIIENEDHCELYGVNEEGFPLSVICDKEGFPLTKLSKYRHGGYMSLTDFMDFLNNAYNELISGETNV